MFDSKKLLKDSSVSLDYSIVFTNDNIERQYLENMIQDFSSKETEKIWNGKFSKKLPTDIQKSGVAVDKLVMLHVANTLADLKIPPGNKLEALIKDRKGQHSIRINTQWRICFVWENGNAHRVEITDYH